MSNKLTKSVTIFSAHQQMDVPTPFLKKTVFLSFNTAKKVFEKIQGRLVMPEKHLKNVTFSVPALKQRFDFYIRLTASYPKFLRKYKTLIDKAPQRKRFVTKQA